MSNARATFASVLGTVTATANTVTTTVSAINDAVGMANRLVKNASTQQEARLKASNESFIDNLIRDMSKQEAEADLREVEFMNKSAEHKTLYVKHFDKYSALLKGKPATE